MTIFTLYIFDAAAGTSNFGKLDVGSAPTGASLTMKSTDGFAVQASGTKLLKRDASVTVFASVFDTPDVPNNTLKITWRSSQAFNCSFAAGTYTISLESEQTSVDPAGLVILNGCLSKGTLQDGSNAATISSVITGVTGYTPGGSGVLSTCVISTSLGAITFANEYLFVVLAANHGYGFA